MREDRYLAGLDVGSTGCKVIVYRTDGTAAGRVYRDCPITRDMGRTRRTPGPSRTR